MYGEQSELKLPTGTQKALKCGVKRIEAHGSTPGCLDARGRDWNSDTIIITTVNGEKLTIEGGCYGLEVSLSK